jgi:hypothetical protein
MSGKETVSLEPKSEKNNKSNFCPLTAGFRTRNDVRHPICDPICAWHDGERCVVWDVLNAIEAMRK